MCIYVCIYRYTHCLHAAGGDASDVELSHAVGRTAVELHRSLLEQVGGYILKTGLTRYICACMGPSMRACVCAYVCVCFSL